MSSKEFFPSEPETDSKGTATGTIKGSLTNLRTNIRYPFLADWIHRDEQGGTLRFHGVMDDPEVPGRRAFVALRLSSSSQPSGTFPVGDPKILYLSYGRYALGNEPGQSYDAVSGEVKLQRQPDNRINGSLRFKTKPDGPNYYDVDVIFDIGEF